MCLTQVGISVSLNSIVLFILFHVGDCRWLTKEEMRILYTAYNIPLAQGDATVSECDDALRHTKPNGFILGSVLIITQLPTSAVCATKLTSSDCVCQIIKELMKEYIPAKDIKYVDYALNNDHCYVRFGSAQACLEVANNINASEGFGQALYDKWVNYRCTPMANDAVKESSTVYPHLQCSVLEGNDEISYWEKIKIDAKNRSNKQVGLNNRTNNKRLKLST